MLQRINKRYAALAALLLLLISFVMYRFTRPLSRDEVAALSIRALEKGDVETLLRLTSTEEREKLNLTRDNVKRFLQQTLWRKGLPGKLTWERMDQPPPDQVIYTVHPADGNNNGLNYPLYVLVTEGPKESWHLDLSYTLYESVAVRAKSQDSQDVPEGFKALAIQYGIRGRHLNTAGYIYLDDTTSHSATSNYP